MTNEQIYDCMQELSKQIRDLEKQNRWHERNELCVEWRELYRAYDWGFVKGQEVFIYRGKRLVPGNLLQCLPENRFLVRYETGGEMIVPGSILKHEAPREPEQLSLFEVIV